jgi:hypothetical protein
LKGDVIMNKGLQNETSLQQHYPMKTCRTCLYRDHNAAESRDNCFRFARFVDHALNQTSRDCDYWSPGPSHP